MRHRILIILGLTLITISLLLAACGGQPEPTLPAPTLEPLRTPAPQPDPVECPEVVCPEPEVVAAVAVPFEEQWAGSPHSDETSESFVHWDAASPPEIPASCARCHSSEGFIDYLGADGTAFREVNQAHERGSVINCTACHNEVTRTLDSVVFPSGAELTGLGNEVVCMQCHQGRASTVQVDSAIENAGLTGDDDVTSEELGFINIHYYAAAATQYGAMAMAGYQYEEQRYDQRFEHVPGYDTCIGCHDSHTLEVKLADCAVCHPTAGSLEAIRDIRMEGSLADYDGDGNVTEGLYYEILGLQELLYQGIQAYATEVSGVPIVYESHTHPYFFIDTDGDGVASEDEAVRANAYNAWSPRLLRAAYNYQTSLKDPGAFVHGGKYIIQLLYDSIVDINSAVSDPIDTSAMRREDPGHFRASAQAFRYWDNTGVVPATCAKCHSGTGLPQFLDEATRSTDGVTGAVVSHAPTLGLECSTCHDDISTFTRYPVDQVRFPSGAIIGFGEGDDNNLCLNCHQGREANATVQAAIQRANVEYDVVSPALSFRNPHYFAAGATLFGDEAQGAYQYPEREYNGRFTHVQNLNTCVQCHDAHALRIPLQACAGCHQGADSLEALRTIRFGSPELDFDGDGELKGIGEEIENMQALLLEAIQAYALENEDTAAIAYSSASHPYWYLDLNENGQVDPDEATRANSYNTWTPRLLAAAYNYQWAQKDPGAFAHNGMYMIQVLYDSLEDIGADVSGMNRPPVETTAEE
jgi:hypothetical protein